MTSQEIRSEIERLIPKAESGEQWAEICAMEVEAVELERECACGRIMSQREYVEQRVCNDCL